MLKVCLAYKDTMAYMQGHWMMVESMIN